MGVCQEHAVDRGRIEPKGRGVLLVEFAASLAERAIDQHPDARSLDEVTRARDGAVGAVKREPHVARLPRRRPPERPRRAVTVAVMPAGAEGCRWPGATRESSPRFPPP